jgi:hypothetical protein
MTLAVQGFNEQLEKLAELAIVLLVGAMLSYGSPSASSRTRAMCRGRWARSSTSSALSWRFRELRRRHHQRQQWLGCARAGTEAKGCA